jgi:hypothetical protein
MKAWGLLEKWAEITVYWLPPMKPHSIATARPLVESQKQRVLAVFW